MDTVVRPPEAPPGQPTVTGTARRRWPRRVGVGALTLALLAIVAGVVWVSNVEPLGPGSSAFAIRDPRVEASERPIDAFDVSGVVDTVKAEKGSTFRYVVSIRNDGPVAVTIKAVGGDGGAISRRAVAVNLHPYENGSVFGPFAPFKLGRGEEAFIQMEVRVSEDGCIEGRGFVGWYAEPITYTIFGITRHSFVETGTEIRLGGARRTPTGC